MFSRGVTLEPIGQNITVSAIDVDGEQTVVFHDVVITLEDLKYLLEVANTRNENSVVLDLCIKTRILKRYD